MHFFIILFKVCVSDLDLRIIKLSYCVFIIHDCDKLSFKLMRVVDENITDWVHELNHHLFIDFWFFFNWNDQILRFIMVSFMLDICKWGEIWWNFVWFQSKDITRLASEFFSSFNSYVQKLQTDYFKIKLLFNFRFFVNILSRILMRISYLFFWCEFKESIKNQALFIVKEVSKINVWQLRRMRLLVIIFFVWINDFNFRKEGCEISVGCKFWISFRQ